MPAVGASRPRRSRAPARPRRRKVRRSIQVRGSAQIEAVGWDRSPTGSPCAGSVVDDAERDRGGAPPSIDALTSAGASRSAPVSTWCAADGARAREPRPRKAAGLRQTSAAGSVFRGRRRSRTPSAAHPVRRGKLYDAESRRRSRPRRTRPARAGDPPVRSAGRRRRSRSPDGNVTVAPGSIAAVRAASGGSGACSSASASRPCSRTSAARGRGGADRRRRRCAAAGELPNRCASMPGQGVARASRNRHARRRRRAAEGVARPVRAGHARSVAPSSSRRGVEDGVLIDARAGLSGGPVEGGAGRGAARGRSPGSGAEHRDRRRRRG